MCPGYCDLLMTKDYGLSCLMSTLSLAPVRIAEVPLHVDDTALGALVLDHCPTPESAMPLA